MKSPVICLLTFTMALMADQSSAFVVPSGHQTKASALYLTPAQAADLEAYAKQAKMDHVDMEEGHRFKSKLQADISRKLEMEKTVGPVSWCKKKLGLAKPQVDACAKLP